MLTVPPVWGGARDQSEGSAKRSSAMDGELHVAVLPRAAALWMEMHLSAPVL